MTLDSLHTQIKRAIEIQDLNAVKEWIRKGADIHKVDGGFMCKTKGENLCYWAVEYKSSDILKYLVSLGVSYTTKSDLLKLVSYKFDIGLIKCMLDLEYTQEQKDKFLKDCYFIAGRHQEFEVIKYLLNNGIDINLCDERNENLLHCLADSINTIEIVKYLVKSGIDINHKNSYGESALDIAIEDEHEEVINYLRDNGSKFSNAKKLDEFSIFKAVESGDLTRVKELIKSGIDINIQNNSEDTLLIEAIENKHTDIVYYLLENGADADILGFDNHIALHVAVDFADLDCFDAVLEKTTDLDILSYGEFGTPLHTACFGSNKEIVSKLLDKGVDIDTLDNDERTPLHIAYMEYSYAIANFLISKGADQTLVDRFGDLAKDLKAQ